MSNLNSFDYFFYHGEQPLDEEIKSEVLATLMQGKRTLYYSRTYNSSGVKDYEGTPNSLVLMIGLPYDVVDALSIRNGRVSDGSTNGRDRRIFVSQDTVSIQQDGQNADVNVEYIQNSDITLKSASLPIGRIR